MFRWFSGGLTNLSYNCLDYHVARGRGGHAALIALDERGERSVYTYAQLLTGVRAVAAALRGLGVGRGDRVGIYMPTMPEAIMAMLAATRIGAIHLVVFAGFGSGALAERLRLAGARVLLTADVTWRKGREVDPERHRRGCAGGPRLAGRAGRDPVAARWGWAEADFRTSTTVERRAATDVGGVPGRGQGTANATRSDGGERAGLRAGHLRHDREAETGGSQPRRLSGRHRTRPAPGVTVSTRRTSGGPRRTSAGSSATPTSSTRRCWPVARRSPTRGRSTGQDPRPSTGSLPRTGSPASSPRRPPSAC